MNYRTLDLTHSKLLTNPGFFNKYNHVYTVVSIMGIAGKVQKIKTTWNKPMKFTVNEAALLVVKIKAERMFIDKKLGEVRVPVKELLEGVTSEGKTMQTVSYPVKGQSGELMGDLTFCYEFGKLVSIEAKKKSVTAYPTGKVAVGGGTRSQSHSVTLFGFGTGFLGGMSIVDAAVSGGGGGGSGCGGAGGF